VGTARTDPDHERDARGEVLYNVMPEQPSAAKRTAEVIAGGSGLEALAGAAAVTLAIIGLAGVWPVAMAATGLVVVGGGLMAHGAAVAARWKDAVRGVDPLHFDRNGVWTGMGSESLGGLISVVLGALVLAGKPPTVLVPSAAVVLGCALLLGGMAVPEVGDLAPGPARTFRYEALVQRLVEGSGGAMVVAGIAAATLGILALLGIEPVLVIELVALLVIGIVLALAGGALTTRFAQRIR
jgi:hypothetical protein